MSSYFITGFDTTLNDTVNYVDLGQLFMDISNNQIINGFVSYSSNPINALTFTIPAQLVNKQYVDNLNLITNSCISFQNMVFTPWVTPVNFTNTIEYPSNVFITKNDITFKPNNMNNTMNNDQIYSFGAGTRSAGTMAGGGIWVMAGQGTCTLAYSYDGIQWYPCSNVFTTYGVSVAWNGSIWVAMGQGTNGLAYSYDGINWVGLGTTIFEAALDLNGIGGSFAWNGVMWVGYGRYNGTANTFIYSYDGIYWFGNGNGGLNAQQTITNHGGQIVWNGTLFCAGSNQQTSNLNIFYSYDGINWTYVRRWSGGANSTYCNAIAWNGNNWTCPASNNWMYYSYDGVQWYAINSSVNWGGGNSYPGWCIWTGAFFLAVGPQNNNNIAISQTGLNDGTYWWVYNNQNGNNGPNMVAYNGNMFVAPFFNTNSAMYSYNAGYSAGPSTMNDTWFTVNYWPFTTKGYFAAWGGRKENTLYLPQTRTLLLGSGVNASIAYSYDVSNNTWNNLNYYTNSWLNGNLIAPWGSGCPGNYYLSSSTKSMNMFISANGAAWDGTKWIAAGTPSNLYTYFTSLTVPSTLNYSNNPTGTSISYFATGTTGSLFFNPGTSTVTSWPNSSWTIEAWIRIPTTGNQNTNTNMGIVGSYNTNFSLGTFNSAGNYYLFVQNATAYDTLNLKDNNWHYVAATVNSGVTNGSYYYVDGVQRPTYFTSVLSTSSYSSYPFCIGTWSTATANNQNFIGNIAEVRIWNYALSPVQIANQWNTNISPTANGLVSYWTNYPTTGTINLSTVLTNIANVNNAPSLNYFSGGIGSNTITYDTTLRPTSYYTYNGLSTLPPQHSLAYSSAYGNTYLGNAGNLWIGMGNYTFSVSANNVAWNGNVWVAVGQGGLGGNSLAYSPDGFTWYGLGNSIFYYWGNSLSWNGTYWVAVGFGANTLAYSPDGVQWTGLGNTVFAVSGNGVNWNGSMWVAVGAAVTTPTLLGNIAYAGNTIAYSVDATNWYGLGNTGFYFQGNDVASNVHGTMWVAAGQGSNATAGNVLLTSYDGIYWYRPGVSTVAGIPNLANPFSLQATSVTHNGKYWVATGIGANSIAYSSDGNTWIGVPPSLVPVNYSTNRAVWNQGLGSLMFKTNYTTTTGVGLTGSSSSQSLWVAVGSPYGTTTTGTIVGNTIGFSKNGLVWWGLGNSIFYNYGTFVAFNGNVWISGGSGANTLAYSFNGINWIGLGNTVFFSQANNAKWNGSIWVAVGQGGNTATTPGNAIAWSTNGINWTGLGGGIFYNPAGYGTTVEWNGQMWVAGGNSGGQNAYGNTLAYSFNGQNWTGLGGNVFSLSCNSILWTGAMFVATGGSGYWNGSVAASNGNTLAYSINGFNWFGLNSLQNNTFFGAPTYGQTLGYNGRVMVAGGCTGAGNLMIGSTPLTTGALNINNSLIGNTLIFSTNNGMSWNLCPGSNNVFTNVCYNIKWDGTMFLAGGQAYTTGVGGGNSLAYSFNGNTWTGLGNNVFSGNVFGIASKNLFGNKIELNMGGAAKTQGLDIVSDSFYQSGHTGLSFIANARPFTSALYPNVVNGNFLGNSFKVNTLTPISGVFGWSTLPALLLDGQNLYIGNTNGGPFGFALCPSPQFLIVQNTVPQNINIYQSIFINPGNYTLTFFAAPRSNAGVPNRYSTANQIVVSISNFNTTYSISTNFTSNTFPWTLYTLNFTIRSADYYNLNFACTYTGNTDSSVGIAEVTIY